MELLKKLQLTFLALMIVFATFSIFTEGTTLDIVFSILAGIFVVLLVGVIVYRSWKHSK